MLCQPFCSPVIGNHKYSKTNSKTQWENRRGEWEREKHDRGDRKRTWLVQIKNNPLWLPAPLKHTMQTIYIQDIYKLIYIYTHIYHIQNWLVHLCSTGCAWRVRYSMGFLMRFFQNCQKQFQSVPERLLLFSRYICMFICCISNIWKYNYHDAAQIGSL